MCNVHYSVHTSVCVLFYMIDDFMFKFRKRDSVTEEVREKLRKAARQFSKKTASDKATLCCTKHRGRLSSIPLSCERRAGLHLCLLSSRKRVLEFNISKYTKAPKELTAMCVCTSAKDRVWVCRTCDYALR